jgi:hypothetical protein
MLGVPGPVPNRSDQRVRRNEPEIPIEKVTEIGVVKIPELRIADAHPFVTAFYDSLKKSAQRKYYEPSDWEYARLTLHFVNKLIWAEKPSPTLLASVNQMLSSLLVTEGDRRRVRIEVERQKAPVGNENVVQVSDLFRQRLGQG